MTQLDPTDYWKLRAVNSDLERDQAALMAVQARLDASRQKRGALWLEMTAKYKLDPDQNYSARDEDCSLVNSNGSQPPPQT